jgi:hypothetical protein
LSVCSLRSDHPSSFSEKVVRVDVLVELGDEFEAGHYVGAVRGVPHGLGALALGMFG